MESARFAAFLVTSINTNRMGHRVSRGNQQIVNWESGRTVALPRGAAERWLDASFPSSARIARTLGDEHSSPPFWRFVAFAPSSAAKTPYLSWWTVSILGLDAHAGFECDSGSKTLGVLRYCPNRAEVTPRLRAFERTVQTCELLVTYAVGVAGKPSKQ